MASARIEVTPRVLIWARESVSLSRPEAARRLSVSEETLTKWEMGKQPPTVIQLRKAAQLYGWPLAVLLLPDPPKDFAPMPDYRRLASGQIGMTREFQVELRRARRQREVLMELREADPAVVVDYDPPPELDLGMGAERAGSAIRDWLRVDLADQLAAYSKYEALNLWVRAAEQRGILVVNFSGVDKDTVAGFSIAEDPYAIVGLNGSDWPRRRLFTLAHELVHIGLGAVGLCDLHEAPESDDFDDVLEHFCNAAAGAVLLPADSLLDEIAPETTLNLPWLDELSSRFSVSSEAILLRLVSLGAATWSHYWELKEELTAAYEDALERQAASSRDDPKPLYYQLKARNLGRGYIRSVLDAYDGDLISARDAADYLTVKFEQIPKLAEKVASS